MSLRICIAALGVLMLSAPSFADPGHSSEKRAYGEPGDPRKPARVVQVTMRETDGKMLFLPDLVQVRKGEQIKFVLRNNGEIDHELVIGTLEENLKHGEQMRRNPDMEHEDPNAKRLAPKKTGEVLWSFSEAGEFDFSCLIPGHREAGMTGKIIVK
ncbi:cupredoxin family protein [Aminobacter sp. P9b]|uniref:Cupredoxin-like copper-binding protein n=1 Tax=Aminobacter niigataensis TaxID=83265 RepID=A0ABR6KZA7_9HYPH|nr:cupredoxin family protein [Aminobacter niigataensis]MBB4649141.1 putative cupredoxin-like copper-binding protein [Aminobacter niigataensis]